MDLEAHKKRKLQDPEAPESVKKQRREESPTSPDVPKPTEETEPHVASLITASPLKNKVGTLPHSTGTDANGNHGVATSECTRSKVKRALRLEESCDDALFSPPLNFTAEIGFSSSESEEDLEYVPLDTDEFNPYQFIALLPSVKPSYPGKTPILPQKTKLAKYTLVLDLDETLVHSEVQPQSGMAFPQPNRVIDLKIQFDGSQFDVLVGVRPGFDEFMKYVSQHFEVVLFTASNRVYADPLIDILDPDRTYFDYRLFRESCLQVNENYIKDLSVLGRDLSTVIMIDNSPHVFGYQLENGVPIKDWFFDPQDKQLTAMLPMLQRIHKGALADIRPYLRKKYKLYKKVQQFKLQISSLVCPSKMVFDPEEKSDIIEATDEGVEDEDEYVRSKVKKPVSAVPN